MHQILLLFFSGIPFLIMSGLIIIAALWMLVHYCLTTDKPLLPTLWRKTSILERIAEGQPPAKRQKRMIRRRHK